MSRNLCELISYGELLVGGLCVWLLRNSDHRIFMNYNWSGSIGQGWMPLRDLWVRLLRNEGHLTFMGTPGVEL